MSCRLRRFRGDLRCHVVHHMLEAARRRRSLLWWLWDPSGAVVDETSGTPHVSPGAAGNKPSKRTLLVVGAALLLGVTTVGAVALASRDRGHDLEVSIGDNAVISRSDCAADQYTGKRVSGTRITVSTAEGAIAASAVLTGDGAFGPAVSRELGAGNGCFWTTSLKGIPDSPAYTIRLEGPEVNQTLTYSRDELAADNWSLALEKNF